MRAMSSVVVARVVGSTAAGAQVLTGTRPARGRAFPGKKKRALVVAVTLLALLAAFAALIPASKAPNADHHSLAHAPFNHRLAARSRVEVDKA